jgi:hypothetical protein
MFKALITSGILFFLSTTPIYADHADDLVIGNKIAAKVGRYTMAVDAFEQQLNHLGGKFRATKVHLKIIKQWTPKLMQKIGKHRSKHEIQGPLNVVNIHNKLVLVSFYREAKGKNMGEIKQALHFMERVMTNIRLDIVQQYGLHIAL